MIKKINVIIILFLVILNHQYTIAQIEKKGISFSFIFPEKKPSNEQENQFSIIDRNTNFTASGSAATALLRNPLFIIGLQDRLKLCSEYENEIEEFQIQPIYSNYSRQAIDTNNSKILSSITQITMEGDSIYVVSRHAIMGNKNLIKEQFYSAHPELVHLQIFEVEVREANHKLDVLFFAKSIDELRRVISLAKVESIDSRFSQQWISLQFGSLGSSLSKSCSEGNSFAIELNEQSEKTGYLGLPNEKNNFSSAGSSGSIVWSIDKDSELRLLGIIVCKQLQSDSSMKESLMRVLSFEKILNEEIKSISFEDAKKTIANLQGFKNCINVDRNGVGADNRENFDE